MNLLLARNSYRLDGVFGELSASDGTRVAATLEHSYDCVPKIPLGNYRCVRGSHRLHHMTEDFETFEIMGVSGHSNILFHWGNFNHDSDGCVLLGEYEVPTDQGGMVTNSRVTFARFMALQEGVQEFNLTVR